MKRRILTGLTILLLALFGPALGQNPPGTLQVKDGWVRLVPGTTLGAYMTLVNPAAKPVRVLSASSSVSKGVSLHETRTVSGGHGGHGTDATGMREVKDFVIPAKGSLQLKPGGLHLMLTGVTKLPRPGQKVTLTLRLEGGQTLRFQLPVDIR